LTLQSSQYYKKLFEEKKKIIENKLSNLFFNNKPESLYEPCTYIIESEGKRLRPLLLLFSKKAVSGNFKNVYNAAVAVELLHNFTLVHDDIMDNSDKRRGKTTLHIKYDLSTAILTGDNLLAIAYNYLLKDCRENDKSVLSTFTNGVIEICEGQSYDKEFETRSDVSLKEYIFMINKKTAALLETCCSIGAQLGGGNKQQIIALSNYGRNLGIAFQIQDDLLDIIADETEFGKIIGGDIVEGKKTYLFLRAIEKAKGGCLKELQYVIKNKGIPRNLINRYKTIYEELGVLEDAKNEIKKYTDKALKELKLSIPSNENKMLTWIANSLIQRNK
jgi:geranylgeranyl diphosphate synthase type II